MPCFFCVGVSVLQVELFLDQTFQQLDMFCSLACMVDPVGVLSAAFVLFGHQPEDHLMSQRRTLIETGL